MPDTGRPLKLLLSQSPLMRLAVAPDYVGKIRLALKAYAVGLDGTEEKNSAEAKRITIEVRTRQY
jgi:hypothetical protein